MDEIMRDCAAKLEQYDGFAAPYIEAMTQVQHQLDHLMKELQINSNHQIIHNYHSRIKGLGSIEKKLCKLGLDTSFESARENLTDIAGIRVICSYKQDVYQVTELLKKRCDFIIIKEKDYISEPKPNGYSSYHLIAGVRAYNLDGCKGYYPVEIQLRTMAMDFWASIEHQLCYKAESGKKEGIKKELKDFSIILDEIEVRMEKMQF